MKRLVWLVSLHHLVSSHVAVYPRVFLARFRQLDHSRHMCAGTHRANAPADPCPGGVRLRMRRRLQRARACQDRPPAAAYSPLPLSWPDFYVRGCRVQCCADDVQPHPQRPGVYQPLL